uniref:Uncharacterized protein n=1 Tax=Talaromyces marneffei PM1 TaxID=1077442 RepID=A0A093UQL4_TALMA
MASQTLDAFNDFQVQLYRQLDEQLKNTWSECLSKNISMLRMSAQDKSECIAKLADDEEIAVLTHHDHEQVLSPKKKSIQGSPNRIMTIKYILQG